MDNSTVHLADDLSIVIALASQEIAEVKGSELENKRLKTLTNQKQLRARNYLFRKIDQIKQIILGKEIHLYDNYGGTIALADVITCLAYMEKHYSQMIEHREIPLNEQLVEIVVDDRCYEILDDTTIPEKDLKIVAGNYNPYSEGMPAIQVKQTRDEDSCLKC